MEVLKRPGNAALDAILGKEIKVLDRGFIRVIDYMGDDAAITQAARVSYGDGTKKTSEDKGLINYLMRNRHTSPFEMCEIKLHVKLPIFVARQWIRHRTANVNEYSARYSVLRDEFYIPDVEMLRSQSASNKQGRGEKLPEGVARLYRDIINGASGNAYDLYTGLLAETKEGAFFGTDGESLEGKGVAREIARMVIPTNVYTEWYWKVDLHNLLHFLSLRADPHAQYEIRAYADEIAKIVEAWAPFTWEAFENHRLNAKTFSGKAMEVLADLTITKTNDHIRKIATYYGLKGTELDDFMRAIGRETIKEG